MKTLRWIVITISISIIMSCSKDSPTESDKMPADSDTNNIEIYPAPEDLSQVKRLWESSNFAVTVNDQPVFVYETANYWVHEARRPENLAAFCSFAMNNNPVTIKITSSFESNSLKIRPLSYNIPFEMSGDTLIVTLSEPKKISVEFSGRKNPLFIFANQMETRDVNARYHYGPGVHDIGDSREIAGGSTVYLAGGAIVNGSFKLTGGSITITGPGILNGGQWTWDDWKANHGLSPFTSWGNDNMTFSDFIIVNAPGWHFAVTVNNKVFRNLKLVSWVGNTDGVWAYGNNDVAEDLFIFNNDDALISNKGSNVLFRNSTVWNGPWGHSIAALVEQTAKARSNVRWENIDIIGDEGFTRDKNATITCFSITQIAPDIAINDFSFKDIRVESPRKNPLIYLNADGFNINNFTFENISVENKNNHEGTLESASGYLIKGLTFKNITMAGEKVGSLEDANIVKKGNVENVNFVE